MKVVTILSIILSIAIIVWAINTYTIELFYDEKKFRINREMTLQSFYPKRKGLISYRQQIPFVIHQTYFTKQMNADIYETCMIIKNMNPEYDYTFYDDKQCRAYVQDHYPADYLKAYDMLIPGAYKADVFRYLVLYREGGVYMDCKSSTIVPLRDFIPETATFAVFRDRPVGSLLNSFMAVTPHHPILKMVIDMTIDNVLHKRYNINSLDITGPQTLGRAFNKLAGRPELEDIEPGVYGPHKDWVILGSFFVIGEGEQEFDALVDASHRPLVSKTVKNYYNNPKRINYQHLWNIQAVYQ